MMNIPNLSFHCSSCYTTGGPILGCRVLVRLTSCCDSLIFGPSRRIVLSSLWRRRISLCNNVNKWWKSKCPHWDNRLTRDDKLLGESHWVNCNWGILSWLLHPGQYASNLYTLELSTFQNFPWLQRYASSSRTFQEWLHRYSTESLALCYDIYAVLGCARLCFMTSHDRSHVLVPSVIFLGKCPVFWSLLWHSAWQWNKRKQVKEKKKKM